MATDKDSIGLTKEGQTILADLEGQEWFGEGQDIARFGLAYAIRAGVGIGAVSKSVDTRWTAGLFDRTGEIRVLIEALYPDCETPVRQMEFLVDEGLRMVSERVSIDRFAPPDLVENAPLNP